jgi:hypothetical protein
MAASGRAALKIVQVVELYRALRDINEPVIRESASIGLLFVRAPGTLAGREDRSARRECRTSRGGRKKVAAGGDSATAAKSRSVNFRCISRGLRFRAAAAHRGNRLAKETITN